MSNTSLCISSSPSITLRVSQASPIRRHSPFHSTHTKVAEGICVNIPRNPSLTSTIHSGRKGGGLSPPPPAHLIVIAEALFRGSVAERELRTPPPSPRQRGRTHFGNWIVLKPPTPLFFKM
ncbi:hypothetical protein CEXT_45121 [Caerostris extrusa]|uniref:Uncharacterized protein n=1 Tax=Caerostris extrusa TaxID=172846 RepID=A0AAV4URH1_CAEEX|nr:hypothetical protein CEXT_45121 [Caerostris extrusa]